MALKNDVTRYELLLETLQLTLRKLQDQCDIMNYQLCNQLGVEGKIVPQLNLNDTIFLHSCATLVMQYSSARCRSICKI